jgi:hypothetical protein
MRSLVEQIVKLIRMTRDLWLIAGVTLLLLALVEGLLTFTFLVRDRLASSSSVLVDPRVDADAYQDRSWAASYYEEFVRSQNARWEPYVYWRQRPYGGEYITITENGLRSAKAPQAVSQSRTPLLKVFMFGGSTLWGTGARDAMTIPAIVEREIRERGLSAEVTNFGQSGYVSTQELIALLLELQKENVPDIVVFYDGVNDTFSALQQGVAGLPQNEFNRVIEFGLATDAAHPRLWSMAFQSTLRDLSAVRFVNGLLSRFDVDRHQKTPGIPRPESGLDHQALAREVVARYQGNVGIATALSKQYGFKALFYWQPTIFQKGHLSKYEASSLRDVQRMKSFFLETYALAQQGIKGREMRSRVRDLSGIFADAREPMYVDWCHLGEAGNILIAGEMAADVVSVADAWSTR